MQLHHNFDNVVAQANMFCIIVDVCVPGDMVTVNGVVRLSNNDDRKFVFKILVLFLQHLLTANHTVSQIL